MTNVIEKLTVSGFDDESRAVTEAYLVFPPSMTETFSFRKELKRTEVTSVGSEIRAF